MTMASSMLIVLLVAFAVAVPPSMAARDVAAAKAAEAPSPSGSGGDDVLYPTDIFGDIIGEIGKDIGQIGKDIGELPDLPLPRILPCPPAFPKIPLIPCHNVTMAPLPPVAACRPGLAKYMAPCAGFLTGGEPSSPPKNCCDVVAPFFQDVTTTPFCLCHFVNGDDGKVFQAPVNHTRASNFLNQCGYGLTSDDVSRICRLNPPPPMDAPSPAPAPSHGANDAGSP